MKTEQQIKQIETLIKETQTTINKYKEELKIKETNLQSIINQLTQIKNQTNHEQKK